MTDTRAAILERLNEPLVLRTIVPRELKAGQVLVDVAYSGVCHSQLHEVRGRRGEDKYLPHTLGHEGSGVVRACGPGVTKVQPGDRVVLTWIKGRGLDGGGHVYDSENGAVNSGPVSTFMERAVVSENRLVPVPSALSLKEAALLGCAIPTGMGIVRNTCKVRAGESVAVFGVGGIGMSAVLAAALAGASPIIAVDVVPAKLEQARALGATYAIDARRADIEKEILDATGGRGVDYAIEAAGRRETMETALRAVRVGGGLCVLAGNLAAGAKISIDPFDLIRGKRIVGTWGGETDPDRDIPHYAEAAIDGHLPLAKLSTEEYALDAVNRALADLEAGVVGRALLRMG